MTKFLRSFRYAFHGLQTAFRQEQNFRIHVLSASSAIALAFFLDLKREEWIWILLCMFLVFMAELFNTALETLVNLVSPSYHELAKKAKDLSAGAVLVAAMFAVIVSLFIFVPKLL